MVKALDFEDIHSRRATIRRAHPHTCKWLLEQRNFLDWTNPARYPDHRGVLWMKGKPGAGKSTIMKYLVEHFEDHYRNNANVAIVSFFFNARGNELGRSTIGMYRSLLGQIFEQLPALQSLLDMPGVLRTTISGPAWAIETLEDLLHHIIKNLGFMRLLCFIDALDECPEDQAREMIDWFERLIELAKPNSFHLCFASRHYPKISMKREHEFFLEHQDGHSRDILNYLETEFVLGRNTLAQELKQKIYNKSGQIFLWVVLAVQILKREYDHGGIHRLAKLLKEIPAEVHELFRGILTRDTIDLPQLVTSIRWILYSRRPLTPIELYHVILCSELSFSELLQPLDEVNSEDIQRYVLSCSKGMIEQTSGSKSTLQFIHGTVRDFLLQPAVLMGLWPGFEGIFEGPSNEILKQHCVTYIKMVISKGVLTVDNKRISASTSRQQSMQNFPFLLYAVDHLLFHAEEAQRCGISQADFICKELDQTAWIALRNQIVTSKAITLETLRADGETYRQSVGIHNPPQWSFGHLENFGFILAATHNPSLFSTYLEAASTDTSTWIQVREYLMLELALLNDRDAFCNVIAVDYARRPSAGATLQHAEVAFVILSREVHQERLRLRNREDYINLQDMTSFLADELRGDGSRVLEGLDESLRNAARTCTSEDVQIFIKAGANTNAQDQAGSSAVHLAIEGITSAEKSWSMSGSWNKADNTGLRLNKERTRRERIIECIQILHENGADLELKNKRGQTPLHLAARCGVSVVVADLLERGAQIDATDVHGRTPFFWALRTGDDDIIEMLRG